MKHYLTLIAVCLLLTSCAPTFYPIKGSSTPSNFIVDKPIDTVWSRIIDVFASKGFSIKIIDKSSGLIVTEKYSFSNSYTNEKLEGTGLFDPTKWVVVQAVMDNNTGNLLSPEKITGEWNVRVKSLGEDISKTSVTVNITNLTATVTMPQYSKTAALITRDLQCYSTGVFEKTFAEMIK
jgi:hypothetical protein